MSPIARPRRWDVLVPSALLVLGLAEIAWVGTDASRPAALLLAAAAALLVLRRALPLVSAPLAVLCMIALPLTGTDMNQVATPIFVIAVSIYSLGRYVAGHGGAVAVAVVVLITLVEFATSQGPGLDPTDVVFVLALAVPPYVFGRIARRMALQTEQLTRQQALIRDQAVQDERDRIARELHDVLAHTLSAMVVQTAAAQDLVRSDPSRAEHLLQSVAETGRSALAETGRLLHLVRHDADERGLSLVPGLSEVPSLVDAARRNGLTVQEDLRLPHHPLTGGVDVLAYRVVQEALTNATRYAAGPVSLVVAATATRLRISCDNPVRSVVSSGSGLGLQGMAERVALLGGTMATRNEAGSFELHVEIPLSESPGP